MRKILLMSVLTSIAVAGVARADTTPAVVTGVATSVSNSSAVLHATINPGGASTAYAFQYGPTITYGALSRANRAGGAKTVPITETLTGLTPGTRYHYRIEATNKLGSAVGRDRVFTTTGPPPPGVITGVVSGVSTTTATLTGTVITRGQTTSAYFQYGPGPSYGMQTPVASVTGAPTPTAASYTLTGLTPGTTFHYRLVASHAGVAPEFGADQAFTTLPLVRFRARTTARTTPRRARHRPYLFTTTGTVVPAVAFPPGVACTGLVTIRYFSGRKAVAFRRVALQSNCTYATQVGFRHLIARKKAQLRVVVRFGGNAYLRPAGARTRRVKLG